MKVRSTIVVILCLLGGWCYAYSYWSVAGRSLPVEFYPFWNACRAIVHNSSPYSDELAEQNQIAMYGHLSKTSGTINEQRFAYPVYAAVPVLAVGFLPFRIANDIAFGLFLLLTLVAVGWVRGVWDRTTLLYQLLACSCYPIIYGIWARQPTVLFFGFAVASLKLLRSGRLAAAGLAAACALGKPHLTAGVILAELVWALADWRERKRFVLGLVGCSAALLAVSWAVRPGWISAWLSTLSRYSSYTPTSPMVTILGAHAGFVISIILLLALIAILWLRRGSDVLLEASFAVVFVQLIVPYVNYNIIMMLVPVVWIFDNATAIAARGELYTFMLGALRTAIIVMIAANFVGVALLHTSKTGIIVAWTFPGLLNRAVFIALLGVMTLYYAKITVSGEKSAASQAPGFAKVHASPEEHAP